jgi:hypothetical protein
MAKHAFIFSEGTWLGEGKIRFSNSPTEISYRTSWSQLSFEPALIALQHKVELSGLPETVTNNFEIIGADSSSFLIKLSNELMEDAVGKGVIEEKKIAWEFRLPHFEGFEVYNLMEDGSYRVHAEYLSSDQFGTIINGKIWKKSV